MVLFRLGRQTPWEKAVSALTISGYVSPEAELVEIPPLWTSTCHQFRTAPEGCWISWVRACRGLEVLCWSPVPAGAWVPLPLKEFSFHQPWGTGT